MAVDHLGLAQRERQVLDPNKAQTSVPRPLISILINNYNYARFLTQAIDSALRQEYELNEILVVDDGSTDHSREIISGYGNRITPIFKENGGQASAFNAGVAASHGDILCFLDADDFFYPQKLTRVVELFREQGVNSKPMMVHHFLALKNASGEDIEGPAFGYTHESPRNLYDFARRHRFVWYEAGPTTTISINRNLADKLFPIPEKGVRISGDDFIVCGASLVGEMYSIKDVLGGYRVHGNNNWFGGARVKSPEFVNILQGYLNTKLIQNGLSPVISFDNSIYAWTALEADRRWFKLAWRIFKLSVTHRDPYTADWAYHTARRSGMAIMKRWRSRTRRLRDALGL
jgi:glycosyltransferase involved in cell wall biosynthesis